MGMRVDIATLFPEMCQRVLDESILGRAAGGGTSRPTVTRSGITPSTVRNRPTTIPTGAAAGWCCTPSPSPTASGDPAAGGTAGPPRPAYRVYDGGRPALHRGARRRLAQYDSLLLVCGHYEGIDERVIEAFADEEISIGDYILTGGELASLVVADSVLRLQPGVLAEQKGYEEESYWNGLLEYPQYTRPEVWEGRAVPPILLSGNHKAVDDWRAEQSRQRTRQRRPDLWEAYLAAGGWDGTPPPKKPSRRRRKKLAEEPLLPGTDGGQTPPDAPQKEE